MKDPLTEARESLQDYTSATKKVGIWANRADKARQAGRKADADRCEDKVRDWASKVKQIERRLSCSQSSK
jgi:hypothetical protein